MFYLSVPATCIKCTNIYVYVTQTVSTCTSRKNEVCHRWDQDCIQCNLSTHKDRNVRRSRLAIRTVGNLRQRGFVEAKIRWVFKRS